MQEEEMIEEGGGIDDQESDISYDDEIEELPED